MKDLDKPISYTTVRDISLTSLKNKGLGKTQFVLRGLRLGGGNGSCKF